MLKEKTLYGLQNQLMFKGGNMPTELIGDIIGIGITIFLVILLVEISPYGEEESVKKVKRPDEPIVPHF